LVEEANRRLSQQSTETAELRVAYAVVKEEVAQAREAEAAAREDAARAREETTKAREDLAPLLARVKELEEDIALVGGQRDALNTQIGMASAHVRTLESEVVTLSGTVLRSPRISSRARRASGFDGSGMLRRSMAATTTFWLARPKTGGSTARSSMMRRLTS
jgi:uncharacterized protein (DUF3084 family)